MVRKNLATNFGVKYLARSKFRHGYTNASKSIEYLLEEGPYEIEDTFSVLGFGSHFSIGAGDRFNRCCFGTTLCVQKLAILPATERR